MHWTVQIDIDYYFECVLIFKSSYFKIELKMNAKYRAHPGLESKLNDASPTVKRGGLNIYAKGPL